MQIFITFYFFYFNFELKSPLVKNPLKYNGYLIDLLLINCRTMLINLLIDK